MFLTFHARNRTEKAIFLIEIQATKVLLRLCLAMYDLYTHVRLWRKQKSARDIRES